jgi:ATP-dependent protease ClpP protease subunit
MTSQLRYGALAALALFIGGGVAWGYLQAEPPAAYPKTGTCEQMDAATLKLSGPIDDSLRDCALSLLTPEIDTVYVTSKGGEVFAGRAIGYKIGEQARHLIIDDLCMSSCGNYFVPAAARLTLLPRSVIGLHGTPDPHMLSNEDMESHMASMVENGDTASEGVARILKRKSERRERQLAEEAKFAAHFNVPKGWRHYREAGDTDDGWRRHFTTGSDTGVTPDKFMIVEGPMLKSCLPHVETEGYQAELEASVLDNAKLWAGLEATMGAYRSFGLACKAQ